MLYPPVGGTFNRSGCSAAIAEPGGVIIIKRLPGRGARKPHKSVTATVSPPQAA